MDRAQLAQAEASLGLAERNHERASELLKRGSGTVQARDQTQSALQADRAAVALARARLDKSTIRAPFAGVVGMSRIDLGAYVTAGQELVSLDDIDRLRLDFTVPERYARFVALGQTVDIVADAVPGKTFTGEIAVIDTRVDPATRALGVRAMVDNRGHGLKPGQFVRAAVRINARPDAIVIPEQAIVPLGDKLLVFRVIDGKAVETPVKIGLREFGRAEIVEGLAPDDTIIVAGQQKVQNGSPVRVLAADAAPPSAAPPAAPASSGPMPANAAEPATRR
jgi:membrane fusion protein (multidrug efflux system)